MCKVVCDGKHTQIYVYVYIYIYIYFFIFDDALSIEDLEGSSRDLIGVLSRHLPDGTEENHERSQFGLPLSRPRFEQAPSEYRSTALLLDQPVRYTRIYIYMSVLID
jgi:hypothetical protein